ncbi:hypothetical protein EJD97_022384 [Solanum chilense]|uniref:Uncharacterized protein n=1 Tax=Solanum chilense TaxID=4083 RepID=A0A6N2AVR5_SOLCI|nr:hypothetical protein EJD97_022384 [Solanum chilense]
MQKRPPMELMTVHRWLRSAAAEGRRGSHTKCGVTKLVTVRHVYDLQVRHEVQRSNPVPIFQELKCFGTKPLDGPLCL